MPEQFDLQTITSGYRTGFIKAMMPFELTPINRIAARRENILVNADNLYHYTSLSGSQGIIDSGGFWASDNRFMNDAQETRHGISTAINILDHSIKRASLDFAVVLTDVRSQLLEPIKNGNLITCFSTARDSLEQWRGYGVNGAVSIRLGQVHDGERHVFFAPHQMALGVKYNARAKSVALLSVLRRFASEYALDRQAMLAGQWPAQHNAHYAEHLLGVLSMQVKAFKDPAFAQEREVRIAVV